MKTKPTSAIRHVAAATFAALVFSCSSVPAAGTFTWTGATSGSWPTATNWDAPITSDNQTDLIFNTTTRTLATSGNGSFIGNPITVRSISYGSGINAAIATSFNFFNAVTPVNLTLSANTGNATITVDAGATGAITLGQAAGVGSNPGALVLSSNLDVVHNGSGQLTFNRAVTGAGALTKTGTGTLAFTGGTVANTYNGLTTVSAGGLTLSKTAATNAIAGNVLVNGTGTLTLAAANQIIDTSNVEVAAGTFALVTFAETVNGVKLNGGAITNTSSAGILTSTTAYDLQSGSASAILAGTAGANKTTAGTVTLSGANTYTGVTTITQGTVSVASIGNGGVAGNLGQAASTATNLVFDGGTLQYTGANATSDRAFTINDGKTATINTANSISFAGATGTATTGALTKTGAGALTLTGTSTYTGNTTISEGTLSMASNLIGSSANIFIGNGAILSAATSGFSMTANQTLTGTGATGSVTGLATLGLATSGNNTISNNAGGQLSLTRLSVFGANNTITAGDIQSGVSGTSRGLNIGNGAAGTLTITGGSLTTNGNATAGDILGSTNGSGVGNLIINGGSYTANSAQGLNIGFGAGSGTLTLTNGNVTLPNLTMAAVNGFSSAVVNINGGTFTLGSLTVTSGNNNQIVFNGGTYVASAPQTLGNGVGNVALNVRNGGAIINTNGNNVTLSNPLLNFAGTSTGGLTKQNTGTLSLSGTNTYIGNTIVQGGTLLLSSTASISNSALIQVQSGAVFDASAVSGGFQLGSGQKLENKGTFLGNLTALSGSTFAPGNSPGISTQTGDLTLNTGSTFEFELVANSTATPGTNYDQTQFTLASTTNLTIQTGVNANLVFNFAGSTVDWTNTFWDSNQSWLLFTGADTSTFGGGSGIFTGTTTVGSISLAQNFSLTGGTFSFSNTGSEVYLNYTAAIPEPSTYAMLVGGLCLLAVLRSRAAERQARPAKEFLS